MKRYYDSANFLINYLQFQNDLIKVAEEQAVIDAMIDDTEAYANESRVNFPSTETFKELENTFLSGRDQVGKFKWDTLSTDMIIPAKGVMKISGLTYKKNKVSLKEGE